ncbi:hypothetical protein JRQ81_004089 [Phrynocephalus forsythii]|uniref:Transcription elongation factor, mitochondrial n=1 Tax=Phrynocephalus forsythii TaxID=171643 RepID=A0A9Q1AXJ4_9SAUR|nr:hypothetical protein JRQ81_004089 [Phrynocephalus forsythii]
MKPMQGRKSANIVEYRDKHGPFENLQNLLEVPLFQYETTVKVCNFILQNRMKEKGERKPRPVSVMKYITPDVDREKLKAADDIVSVVFGTRKIAWAHVDRNLAVLDWQQRDSKVFMKGTYVPAMYLEEISSVVSRFPEADFYVLEKSGRAKVNAASFPVSLHLRTVEAMLYALLHKTFAQDGQPKVLSISRNAVGKYFGLIVGDVRTSGIDLVKEFISDSLTQAEASRVRFPSHQIFHYRNALSSPQKRDEELCDSLLQAVAFCEIFLQNKMT